VIVAGLLTACSVIKPEPPLRSQSGLKLYQQLCASCHGVEGYGDGPVAPSIKVPVPDLTRLAARDGGEFPREDVRLVIDGRSDRRAHGPRDMPVWGWQLYESRNNNDAAARAQTNALIDQLVRYLESIQRL
jgi:mono/diheme cytochrome c family protein